MKYNKFGVTCKERIWTEEVHRWVGVTCNERIWTEKVSRWVRMDIGEAVWVDENVCVGLGTWKEWMSSIW